MSNIKRHNYIRIIKPIILLIGILCLLFLIIFGFNKALEVKKISVIGNNRYSQSEISEFVKTNIWDENILTMKMHYALNPPKFETLDKVKVKVKSLHEIEVHIKEVPLKYAFKFKSYYYFINKNNVIIYKSNSNKEKIKTIDGAGLDKPKLYHKIHFDNSDTIKDLDLIFKRLQNINILNVEIEDNVRYKVKIKDIEINLGTSDNLQAKLNQVTSILNELKGKTGVLHLENYAGDSQTITFKNSGENS